MSATIDLKAVFNLRQGNLNLFAKFELRQGYADLYSEFVIRHTAIKDLYARVYVKEGVIGPAIITTATYDAVIRYPVQRLSFFAANLHWVFYSDGANGQYRTSTNGINWSSPTSVGTVQASGQLCCHYDGVYAHYFRFANSTGGLYYRRGKPETDGSITWSAVEQMIFSNWPENLLHPSIAVLQGGYPAVIYVRSDGVYYRPRVIISDNNDGTWSGSEVETTLHNYNTPDWGVSLHTLGAGLYALFGRDGTELYGKEYIGGTWQGQENTGYIPRGGILRTDVEKNGEIHVAYHDNTDRDIYHGRRTVGGVWQPKTLVQVNSLPWPSTNIIAGSSVIYIFWGVQSAGAIYYRKSIDNGATWTDEAGNDTPQKFKDTIGILIADFDLQVYERIVGGHIDVMWNTGTAPPYTVYFAGFNPLDTTPQNLFSDFMIRQIGDSDLFAETVIRQTTTKDLFCKFEIQDHEDLYAKLIVRHIGSADLVAEFIVRHTAISDLFSKAIIRQSASTDLHSFFHVGQDSKQLLAEFIVRHTSTLDLFAELVSRHSSEKELHVSFHVGQDSEPLRALVLFNGIGYIVKGAYVF